MSGSFEPIAIVGRACVLPGALSPEELFEAVRSARVMIDEAPEGAWGLDSRRLLHEQSPGPSSEYVVSNRGGYVTGFDKIFDESYFVDRIKDPGRLDDLTRWLLHCSRVALAEAGIESVPSGTGLIVGNLSYPTVEHTRFVQDHWLETGEHAPRSGRVATSSDPRNRFSSGGPAHMVAHALGLDGDVFALDAACASSLYAIEIACRRLQDQEADLMLAGGVARADPLFIHLGFTALQALSPTGQSRPLHKGADGLLPAEGAGLVALKRLSDAYTDDDRIFGVIRGVGLSNDGRQSGFLAPAMDGQVRAMKAAYEAAGLEPRDIDFIECHATGTPRGDTIELESLAQVWAGSPKPVIGSLKGNIGHPITASGVASLLKVLSSFDEKVLPPTPCDNPLDAIETHGFRLLAEEEAWESDGPRRAAISNFGFGGNNAHLIVEEWVAPEGSGDQGLVISEYPQPSQGREAIAIAGIGVIAGETVGLPGFVRRLVAARDEEGTKSTEVVLSMTNLGFPPNDLQESLAQQTSILAVVEEALRQVGGLNPDRTGVYIGMCVDPQAARHGLRVRLQEVLSDDVDMAGWREVNARSARHLTAAGVIGCMPNIPANRVHAQQDWRAPGFTVASEELSGVDALKLAARALQAREIDCALVGASDFSHESAHRDAATRVLPEDRHRPGDAAVGLVVMREKDAIDKGYPIFASIVEDGEMPPEGPVSLSLVPEENESEVTARFGHAHGASGLLHIAAGAVMAQLGVTLDEEGAWPAPRNKNTAHTHVSIRSFMGLEGDVFLRAPDRTTDLISPIDVPVTRFFASGALSDLGSDVLAGRESNEGEVRVALVGRTEEDVERLAAHAAQELIGGREPNAPGIFFGSGRHDGEVAFCYTGAAAAYPGAGRDLLMAFPEIGHDLTERFAGTPKLASDLYGAGITGFSPATQLTGSSFVCQAHTQFTRVVLGMKPDAAIGLSSGETNSLMAFGVWNDLDDMIAEIDDSEMYVNQLTAECRAAAQYWDLPEGELPEWKNYRIAAPLEVIQEAMEGEDRVYVTVIHHYEDIVIGGDAGGCDRVVEKVGRSRAIDLGLDMVVHCAPLAPFEQRWHDIHLRDTSSVPEVRFYTNAWNSAYVPTRESAAEAITRQAIDPVDFPKTLEAAYDDGVRIFVEHGPRAILTNAIGRILGDRPHLVVALDPHEGAGLEALTRSVARLWAAGVPIDLTQFLSRIAGLRLGGEPFAAPEGALLRLPAHAPDVVWPKSFIRPTPRDIAAKTMDESNSDGNVMTPPPSDGFDYDVGQHFVQSSVIPTPRAEVEPPIPSASVDQVAVSDPALELFNAVAQAHADFLQEQKETHEAFLAIGLGSTTGTSAVATVEPGDLPDLRVVVEPTEGPLSHGEWETLGPQGSSLDTSDSEEDMKETSAASEKPTGPPSPVIPTHPPIDRAAMPETFFLTREQLEIHAGGKISSIFGELFEKQDGYERQVRMPEPPLLFADRALTIEGEPGSMKKGRVVTETDVKHDAWYLHTGRMAPGVVIESGQADLLLISWLGADFLNQSDRVYRLLGCDLTFHGDLPAPGDTLTYDIYVDGHAKTGDVRLFFFHYDCYIGDRLLISVRNGQAGFFTEEELSGSGGVLWDAGEDEPDSNAVLDPMPQISKKSNFTCEEVQAWVDGDAFTCFGEGFEMSCTHTRTPNTPDGRLQLIDHIPEWDPIGGPWGRGYLRAEAQVSADAWFYEGHFKNDSCMPGTLMADAATQAMSFAMAAMGFTISRDGWRFEPVPGEVARFLCRGQVIPDGPHTLEYEIFIEDVVDGPIPEVYAALLCKSDGFKVFQCRRFGLRLVPDFPLTTKQEFLKDDPIRFVGPAGSDVRGDHEAMLSCAWGRPSDAFGKMFTRYDGPTKCPRLPGPPYHFVSSVVSVDVAPGSAPNEGTLVSTFEVEPDAWYFDEGQGHMPFAIIVEALLQPCGWFASYCNFFADTEGDVAFRNLDGENCILHRPIKPDMGTLTLTTKLTRFAKAGGTSIVFFEVLCENDDGPVMTLETDFGFFNPQILEDQRGLPMTEEMRARRDAESPLPELSLLDGGGELAHLPGMKSGTMRMLDKVTGFWDEGGEAGLGSIRTWQEIHHDAWYFKAHFFEDPVQPGSLGLEALIQSARALVHMKGWLEGIDNPVWEHPVVGFPLSWKYRGQVVPKRDEVVTEVEALKVDIVDGESVTVEVFGTQWVDGLRIYEVPSFAVRVRASD